MTLHFNSTRKSTKIILPQMQDCRGSFESEVNQTPTLSPKGSLLHFTCTEVVGSTPSLSEENIVLKIEIEFVLMKCQVCFINKVKN